MKSHHLDHLSATGAQSLIQHHPKQTIKSIILTCPIESAGRHKAEVMSVLERLDPLFSSSASNKIVQSQFLVKFTGFPPAEQLWAKGLVFYDY